jgi:Sec7-like guanine-nucleotide exchange factor
LAAFDIPPGDAIELAHLFLTIYDFDGRKLGEFLSSPGAIQICAAYFSEMDLSGSFLQAFRRGFAGPVQLPAEGEQIDRLLEIFARCFQMQSPEAFSSSDMCYVLSYAVMMLNTNLHNEHMMKHRMTKEGFLAQLRDSPFLTEETLPTNEVFEIFESIRARPLVFGTSRSQLFSPDAEKMCGLLHKCSKRRKLRMVQRYFVLVHMSLWYYASEHASHGQPMGLIILNNVEVKAETDSRSIRITAREGEDIGYQKFRNDNAMPILDVKKIYLRCPTEMDKEKWLHRMNEYVVSWQWPEVLKFHVDGVD